MRYTVRVMLNVNLFTDDPRRRSMLGGYEDGDTLNEAVTIQMEADSPQAACETAFAVCNSYPEEMHCGVEWALAVALYRAGHHRSLSVGDVCIVTEAFDDPTILHRNTESWVCESLGFERIPNVPEALASR